MPRSIYFIDLAIVIFFTCGIRYSYRIARVFAKIISGRNATTNIMLIGGGEAARLLIDEMNRNQSVALQILFNKFKIPTRSSCAV